MIDEKTKLADVAEELRATKYKAIVEELQRLKNDEKAIVKAMTTQDVATLIEADYDTAKYHLRRMLDLGLVKSERRGEKGMIYYFV